MTWIFAEDFEGCECKAPMNLAVAPYLSIGISVTSTKDNQMDVPCRSYDNCINFGNENIWWFGDYAQAKAAYDKIKGMLRNIGQPERIEIKSALPIDAELLQFNPYLPQTLFKDLIDAYSKGGGDIWQSKRLLRCLDTDNIFTPNGLKRAADDSGISVSTYLRRIPNCGKVCIDLLRRVYNYHGIDFK